MRPGDLLQTVRIGSGPRLLGMLLKPPHPPRWGNFPMRYTVLTPDGIKEILEQRNIEVQVVP